MQEGEACADVMVKNLGNILRAQWSHWKALHWGGTSAWLLCGDGWEGAWAEREPPVAKAGEESMFGRGPAFQMPTFPLKRPQWNSTGGFPSIWVYMMYISSCRLKAGLPQEYEVARLPTGLEIEIIARKMFSYWITQEACGKLGETPNLGKPQSVVQHGGMDRIWDFSWDLC